MKQGKRDCPCESVVTLDTCAVELPTIAALEMFRKKKKSKIQDIKWSASPLSPSFDHKAEILNSIWEMNV